MTQNKTLKQLAQDAYISTLPEADQQFYTVGFRVSKADLIAEVISVNLRSLFAPFWCGDQFSQMHLDTDQMNVIKLLSKRVLNRNIVDCFTGIPEPVGGDAFPTGQQIRDTFDYVMHEQYRGSIYKIESVLQDQTSRIRRQATDAVQAIQDPSPSQELLQHTIRDGGSIWYNTKYFYQSPYHPNRLPIDYKAQATAMATLLAGQDIKTLYSLLPMPLIDLLAQRLAEMDQTIFQRSGSFLYEKDEGQLAALTESQINPDLAYDGEIHELPVHMQQNYDLFPEDKYHISLLSELTPEMIEAFLVVAYKADAGSHASFDEIMPALGGDQALSMLKTAIENQR